MPTAADVSVSALQSVTPSGGSATMVTIPALPGSTTALVTTVAMASCAAGTACATYTLIVPPGNPSSATFGGGTTYSVPGLPPVLYTVEARATVPDGTATPNCTPSELMTSLDSAAMALMVMPGVITTAQTLAFVSCTAGF